jgi:hypothetical protein
MNGPNSFRAERELAATGEFKNDSHLTPFMISVGVCAVGMPALYFLFKALFA